MSRLRYITAICAILLCALCSTAQLKYTEGSFRLTNAADMQASGTNIGKKNMTASLTDFAPSHDDDQIKSGIIRVGFKNLASEDLENHVLASVNPGHVNRSEYRRNPTTNALECWLHLDPGTDLVLNINVEGIGAVRIPNLKVESERMYALEIESAEMIPVTFSSNVDGTAVWFDGAPLDGQTAKDKFVSKDKTTMGRHHVKAVAGNRSKEFDIEVSKANNHFPIDLLRKYTVQFESNEPGVTLYEGGKVLGTLPMSTEITEGPHSFVVRKPGYDDKAYNVNITGNSRHRFDIHKNKTIDFYALSNNTDYRGASVYIDNELRGQTPLQLTLPYGRYNVRMSAYGRDKSDKLVVDDNTASRFMLKLPARHRRFNPFDIDFHRREFGLTAGYVQKWMHISDGKSSISTNYFGEEKHMHGFQIGVPVQPIFGYGLGLNTGLYFEAYFADWTDTENYGDKFNMTEYCMYMPVDLMFRLPLGENFSIYVNGGIGIDWSIETELTAEGYDDYKIDYGEDGAPNHFNFSAEFGGGIQYKALQVSGNYQIGLNNNSKMVNDEVTAKLRKFSVQLSLMF